MLVPFPRLTIARKLLMGYLTLVVIIFLISAVALTSLVQLNTVSRSMMELNIPFIEMSEEMIDNIFVQELHVRRSAILKSPATLAVFREKRRDFEALLEKILALPGMNNSDVNRIAPLYREYNRVLVAVAEDPAFLSSANKYDAEIKSRQDELVAHIKGISAKVRKEQREKTLKASRIGVVAFRNTALLCLVGVILGILATALITRSIAVPIARLKIATRELSEGNFDKRVRIRNHDELGDLSRAFNDMAERLKHLERMHLDASPLTRLPGSSAIESALTERIESGKPLAFCFFDLDNFKAFNDRYGYARGSEVIKATAAIIEEKVSAHGGPDDFVGHVGGDDLVVITTPDRCRDICSAVIATFDAAIPGFYEEEDRRRGYIEGKTRQGDTAKFPIMSISSAVVTNQHHRITSYLQVGKIAAELKQYAKTIPTSVCVVDRRVQE